MDSVNKSNGYVKLRSTENMSIGANEKEDEKLEREHFRRIVNAFRFYRAHSLQRIKKTENYLKTLPANHQKLLDNYWHHLQNVRVAVEHNYEIINLIIKDVAQMFENVDHSTEMVCHSNGDVPFLQDMPVEGPKPIHRASNVDMDKVQSTLKQFVRDWSEEGAKERQACYQPIIDEIERRFSSNLCNPHEVSILVPGAGLGRLAYEIAKRGFTCQGNEFSLFMLFASNFILNRCQGVKHLRLYPWIHQVCNNFSYEHQMSQVLFPDVNPSDLPTNSHFSMAAGDFLEVYTDSDCWDCVATCFFIDTANNIVAYIETIWKILKPGGYWINLGPLLYHFADMPNENSIEPSYKDVRNIIQQMGFHILKEDTKVATAYSQNASSMLQYQYDSVFFVCQKPIVSNNPSELSKLACASR